MSALGHKQTYAVQKDMSALAPIATVKADMPQTVMSALPPIADMCGATAHVGFGPIADMERSITGWLRSYQIRTVRPRQCPRHDRVASLSGHCIELTLKTISRF